MKVQSLQRTDIIIHFIVLVFWRQDNFAGFFKTLTCNSLFVFPEEGLQKQVKEILMIKSQINHINPCS